MNNMFFYIAVIIIFAIQLYVLLKILDASKKLSTELTKIMTFVVYFKEKSEQDNDTFEKQHSSFDKNEMNDM